ncbi:hypothetical protein VQH23_16250 [Pararoseomonas sp. SCSIO 73927]|uniref:hypothetical protein n=1 Tax=Pararoseomonas sp. SCSIO 73927 TaxID=3114537 RepID=UPI0030CD39F0
MARIALREACYAALAARLVAALTGVPLERNRRSQISDQEEFPSLVLRDGGQVPMDDSESMGEFARHMTATLEGYVRSPDADAGAEASDLYARAAEALCDTPVIPDATLPGGVQIEIYVTEGALDFDAATVAESSKPIAAFYLDLSFAVRVPFGTRFLESR